MPVYSQPADRHGGVASASPASVCYGDHYWAERSFNQSIIVQSGKCNNERAQAAETGLEGPRAERLSPRYCGVCSTILAIDAFRIVAVGLEFVPVAIGGVHQSAISAHCP